MVELKKDVVELNVTKLKRVKGRVTCKLSHNVFGLFSHVLVCAIIMGGVLQTSSYCSVVLVVIWVHGLK